ncbi:hypothetical protein ACTXT7_001348 [Hymenolepis weldensis]
MPYPRFLDLALDDASAEFASKPVVLQPYLHPEVSSVGACCIMIRLSTQRLLRIVQLVLISSSPHIDFVDRYGETLARIEGVLVPNSGEELYRCSSGRLSPHTECVVRSSNPLEESWLTFLDTIIFGTTWLANTWRRPLMCITSGHFEYESTKIRGSLDNSKKTKIDVGPRGLRECMRS